MPLKFSKKATLEPFGFLNRENATYALGHVACQCWVLIVTLLSQSAGKHSQESLSSLKCVVPYCRPTSEHREETDVWTFAVKLSQKLCQGDGGKIPNFASNYLPTSVLQWEVIMAVNHTKSKVKNSFFCANKTCKTINVENSRYAFNYCYLKRIMLLHVMLKCIKSINQEQTKSNIK